MPDERAGNPWPRVYLRGGYTWGTEESGFAREVARYLSGGRVLDLGCGEGRDAVFFAKQGCEVTGVDISRAGIAKARKLARMKEVKATWMVADLATFRPSREFDLIYSSGSIHYLPRRVRAHLFARLKAQTKPHGFNAHIVFTDRLVYVEFGEVIDYFHTGELRNEYRDWEVLVYKQLQINCRLDGTPHRHGIAKLIARRPADTAA
jgi:tellurite methyltransferase